MKEPVNQRAPDVAQMTSLLTHPAAGAAALSALGVGMASQAMGNWLGVWAAAADASQRFWAPLVTGHPALLGEKDVAAHADTGLAEPKMADNVVPLRAIEKAPAGVARAQEAMPADADDLKAIAGIGPKMEQVLNGLGVSTYRQIASWTTEDATRIENAIGFAGRVERDGWVAQAAGLAAGARVASGGDI